MSSVRWQHDNARHASIHTFPGQTSNQIVVRQQLHKAPPKNKAVALVLLHLCVCIVSHELCRLLQADASDHGGMPTFEHMACVTDGKCCMQCMEACLTCCAFSASSLSCSLCSQSSSRFNAARRACAMKSSFKPPSFQKRSFNKSFKGVNKNT